MRSLVALSLYIFIGLGTAKAALIDYEFNTLIFSDNHQITGGFTLDSDTNELVALSISLWGSLHNIEFDMSHLTSPDAFSITFDNRAFGDNDDEGFQLFNNNVYLATGDYGLGAQDTCFFDPETCTASLFTFQKVTSTVSTPGINYLLGLGLLLIFRRKIIS
ncbi:hypothetical protein [Paraglaciecola aestuariivivens]